MEVCQCDGGFSVLIHAVSSWVSVEKCRLAGLSNTAYLRPFVHQLSMLANEGDACADIQEQMLDVILFWIDSSCVSSGPY